MNYSPVLWIILQKRISWWFGT